VPGGIRSFVNGLEPWQRGLVAAIVSACIWAPAYFFFLRMPLPGGWTIRGATLACLAGGCVAGAAGCLVSRRLWPIAVGAAAAIILGGAEAVWSDVSMSYWERVRSGLVVAPLPLYLWLCIVSAWMVVSVTLGRWEFGRAVIDTATTARRGRRTRR
jgi:hypothetical protein